MKKQKYYLALILFIASCSKNQDVKVDFTVVSKISDLHSAAIEFNFEMTDDVVVTEAGIIFSKKSNPTFLNAEDYNSGKYPEYFWKRSESLGSKHKVLIENLSEYTKYYFKPYCVAQGMVQYGNLDSIQTAIPPGVSIGPAGGYVVYDDGLGGGIEMALDDIEIIDEYGYLQNFFIWGCNGSSITGTSANIGAGKLNTDTINFYCNGLENAAYLCTQFSYNGFSDWYLPSANELIEANSAFASQGFGNFGASPGDYYWSSTEIDAFNSATVFMGGYTATYSPKEKNYSLKVRPFRTF